MTELERPAGVPLTFQPVIDTDGLVTGWAEPSPPKAEPKSDLEFNFAYGNLGRVKRIVARRKLKDRIAFYELLLKTHQPLIKAMQVTQHAFQQGMQEGIRQVAQAEAEKAQATSSAEPVVQTTGEIVPPIHTQEDGAPLYVECGATVSL